MTRICTICARGGSKGLPSKNIRPLLGKPLIAWTIGQALQSGLFDMVAVSSDSDAILAAATEAGAHLAVRRPDELATDTAAKVPAIQHAMLAAEAELGRECDVVVDLDATAPLRLPEDIQGAIALLDETTPNVITGARSRHTPYRDLVEIDDQGFARPSKVSATPPACFDINGSVYVWRRAPLMERGVVLYPGTRLFEMPRERSFDIDSAIDFEIVKLLMEARVQ